MAQSFKAISLSLGEAERQKDGKPWTQSDYAEHQSKHYNVDSELSHLNTVIVSAGGRSEREIVNDFLEKRMIELNQAKIDKVKKWNDAHRDQIDPKKNKLYKMKSVDKRQLYAVGKYKGNKRCKRAMPYDVFKKSIEQGNARAKNGETRYRSSVLQQYAVGIGNIDEWANDDVRKKLKWSLHLKNYPDIQKQAVDSLNDKFFKPYLKRFEKENPSLHVVQAVVHFDESNPHLQFTVMPWRDGTESGGLGSTGYTTCMKNDHPDMKPSKIIDEVYQQQHNEIREILKSTDFGKDKFMSLGERPGSHKSIRVDKLSELKNKETEELGLLNLGHKRLSKKQDEIDKSVEETKRKNSLAVQQTEMKNHLAVERTNQQNRLSVEATKKQNEKAMKKVSEFVEKQKAQARYEINLAVNYVKTQIAQSISELNPQNKVPKELVKNKPEVISTAVGMSQHTGQDFDFLIQTFKRLVDTGGRKEHKIHATKKPAVPQSKAIDIAKQPTIDMGKIKSEAYQSGYRAGYVSAQKEFKSNFGARALEETAPSNSPKLKYKSAKSQSLNDSLDARMDSIHNDDRGGREYSQGEGLHK